MPFNRFRQTSLVLPAFLLELCVPSVHLLHFGELALHELDLFVDLFGVPLLFADLSTQTLDGFVAHKHFLLESVDSSLVLFGLGVEVLPKSLVIAAQL